MPSMFDLRKLFVREAPPPREGGRGIDPESAYGDEQPAGLELEYQGLIAAQLQRWGISADAVTIEVRQIGHAADGLAVFIGMVRLARWHRISALRVLLGLPLLENKIRRKVRNSWIADLSHFAGLWLHASEQLAATPALGELRDLMRELAPPRPYPAGETDPASGDENSSHPPSLSGGTGPAHTVPAALAQERDTAADAAVLRG